MAKLPTRSPTHEDVPASRLAAMGLELEDIADGDTVATGSPLYGGSASDATTTVATVDVEIDSGGFSSADVSCTGCGSGSARVSTCKYTADSSGSSSSSAATSSTPSSP